MDTLFELLDGEDTERTAAFLSVISNAPDVILEERKLSSLAYDIDSFRKKYGREYFENTFGKDEMPKSRLDYFSPESDEWFKKRHPIGYWVLVGFGIAAIVAPLIAFIVLSQIFNLELNGWTFLCIVGCFIVGTGLFNIVAAFIKQYLGHLITFGCLTVGGFMIFAGIKLMETDYFTDEQVNFYFITLLFLLIPLLLYPWFRHSVHFLLRSEKKLSRSAIKRNMTGKRNFWWYKALHEAEGLGALYYLNLIFTILYPTAFLTAFFFGFIKVMSIPILILSALTYINALVMLACAQIKKNIREYGSPLVLWIKGKYLDIFTWIFLLVILYAHLLLFNSLWSFEFLSSIQIFK